jgi:hypothetical protein
VIPIFIQIGCFKDLPNETAINLTEQDAANGKIVE